MFGWKRQGMRARYAVSPDLMRQMREALNRVEVPASVVVAGTCTRCAESCGAECLSRLQLHELLHAPKGPATIGHNDSARSPSPVRTRILLTA
jgi:hypothetical protein